MKRIRIQQKGSGKERSSKLDARAANDRSDLLRETAELIEEITLLMSARTR